MNRPHFRRRPRPTDPEPRLDWLDWLPGRVVATHFYVRKDGTVEQNLDALPPLTRYDVEWPDVIAAEAGGWVGGDLAAMAAPADWPMGDYGEGYEIGPEERVAAQPAHHPRHAWTPTPPVDEADVEALAGLMDDAQAAVMSATSLARRLLATGRVQVTR